MKYKLSIDALNDLQEIWDYSFKNWGDKQAISYVNKLIDCFEKIACGDILYKNITLEDKIIKSVLCDHHYIFFSSGNEIVVVRVLHEKRDYIAALKKGLLE
jgi:toxin ParE1/3/4